MFGCARGCVAEVQSKLVLASGVVWGVPGGFSSQSLLVWVLQELWVVENGSAEVVERFVRSMLVILHLLKFGRLSAH